MQTDLEVASAISAQTAIAGVFNENAGLGKTILLVEPEPFVRKATAEVLKSAGYGVLVARDAIDALEACARHPQSVDLLLSDFVIPRTNSCQFAMEFNIRYPRAPILLLGNSENDLAMSQPAAFWKTYLHKPFSVFLLLNKVREALNRNEIESNSSSSI